MREKTNTIHFSSGGKNITSELTEEENDRIIKISRKNMERCASFVARMILKYGDEVLADIEREELIKKHCKVS